MQYVEQRYEAECPVESLKPRSDNPNVGDIEGIEESIGELGFYGAVLAHEGSGFILAGKHRWEAARRQGAETIPVLWARVDDETQQKKIMAGDNRWARRGHDDERMLADLLSSLDGDLVGTGYESEDLARLLAGLEERPTGKTDPDAVPDAPSVAVTKPGDLWLLGDHRVLCGDARSGAVVQSVMGGGQAQIVFTSPPYASQREYDTASGFVPVPPDKYLGWFAPAAAAVQSVLAADGSYFLNIKEHCADGQRSLYVKELTLEHVRRWGWMFVDEFCWVDTKNGVPGGWGNRFKDAWEPVFHYARAGEIKFRPLANGADSDAVFAYSPLSGKTTTGSGLLGVKAVPEETGVARPSNVLHIAAASSGGHSAAFPVDLPAWFIRAFTDPGDSVLDPFCGSGSTLIASHKEGRVGFGIELSPLYVDVVCRRFQEHTGIVPRRENGTEVSFTK